MERVKWTDKIKNAVLLERVGEGRIMLELIKKRKINWLSHWLRRDCLLKDALEGMANGKKVRGRRIYQIIDNIMINGLYEDTKRKAEKRVERSRAHSPNFPSLPLPHSSFSNSSVALPTS